MKKQRLVQQRSYNDSTWTEKDGQNRIENRAIETKTKLTLLFHTYIRLQYNKRKQYEKKLKRVILLCKYEMASNGSSMTSTENQKQKNEKETEMKSENI